MERENILIKGDCLDALKLLCNEKKLSGRIRLAYVDPPYPTAELQGPAYMELLYSPLSIIRELMASDGSLYLQTDSKSSHFIKVMLDGIFGPKAFRNDIARIRSNPKNISSTVYGNIKDNILFYTKGSKAVWHEPRIPMSKADIERLYTKKDSKGRRYTTIPIHAPGESKSGSTGGMFKGMLPPKGRHWRTSVEELERLDAEGLIEWSKTGVPRKINYADEHATKKLQDIWDFKDPMYPIYPTEKNQEMLRVIINASSNADDIVLDCFAGSGGFLTNATELNRQWIGIDNSAEAIAIIRNRLDSANIPYQYIELF